MQHEKSCGAVVFTEIEGERRYVIVQSREGVHGFPKGHVESGEMEAETALREVFEETGLRPRLIEGFRAVEEHPISAETTKQVVYFLAQYGGQRIRVQESELRRIELLSYDEARSRFEFESAKRILKEADEFISSR